MCAKCSRCKVFALVSKRKYFGVTTAKARMRKRNNEELHGPKKKGGSKAQYSRMKIWLEIRVKLLGLEE